MKTVNIKNAVVPSFIFAKKGYEDTITLLKRCSKHVQENNSMPVSEERYANTYAMQYVTAKLISVLAWLTACKTIESGEMTLSELSEPKHRMVEVVTLPENVRSVLMTLSGPAPSLIEESEELYDRMRNIETRIVSNK